MENTRYLPVFSPFMGFFSFMEGDIENLEKVVKTKRVLSCR